MAGYRYAGQLYNHLLCVLRLLYSNQITSLPVGIFSKQSALSLLWVSFKYDWMWCGTAQRVYCTVAKHISARLWIGDLFSRCTMYICMCWSCLGTLITLIIVSSWLLEFHWPWGQQEIFPPWTLVVVVVGGGQLMGCVFYLFQDLMMILSGPSPTPAVSLLLLYSEPHSIYMQWTHSSMYALRCLISTTLSCDFCHTVFSNQSTSQQPAELSADPGVRRFAITGRAVSWTHALYLVTVYVYTRQIPALSHSW